MNKFIPFTSDLTDITIPNEIDYPYNYSPHSLAKIASYELQEYLKNQTDFVYDFDIIKNIQNPSGKMFGVLVVQKNNGELGYISAFSGKLADRTIHKHFVPPVYNVLDEDGFYIKTEKEIDILNLKIKDIEKDAGYLKAKKTYNELQSYNENKLKDEKEKYKVLRKTRKLNKQINNQLNINEEFFLREYEEFLNAKITPFKNLYEKYQTKIDNYKSQRKKKSALGQKEIFNQYQFLNSLGEKENLLDIFKESTQNIPAGAGECCAPKLFQYAFLYNLKPIALAEFWWGKPLKTAIRKHKNFYPACNGKCKPILTHMLKGLSVKENPLIDQLKRTKELEIIFEDDFLLVINKPHELLSIPGNEIKDSVYTRIKKKYPKASGPLLVHRLDMSTSGILLIAKTKEIHKELQAQFINKTIKKRYVALLDGCLPNKNGIINLPLTVDFFERPKHKVCYENGKKATTKWNIISTKENRTMVHFYPITGRTHQLRIHSAHQEGLNTPIVGDDLYGKRSDRLYLHAEFIKFKHPISRKEISFTVKTPF